MTREELDRKMADLRALRGTWTNGPPIYLVPNDTSSVPAAVREAIPVLTPEQEMLIALYDFLLDLETRI